MILQFCILIFDLEGQKHLLNSANHESENNNTHHLNEHLSINLIKERNLNN